AAASAGHRKGVNGTMAHRRCNRHPRDGRTARANCQRGRPSILPALWHRITNFLRPCSRPLPRPPRAAPPPGSQRSNRRVPSEVLGGLDGDAPARAIIEEQDRLVAERSGTPAIAVRQQKDRRGHAIVAIRISIAPVGMPWLWVLAFEHYAD